MKKLLSWILAATLLVALPTFALAGKGTSVGGKVTAVTATSITVTQSKKHGRKSETITVPAGTPITEKGGGTAPALSELVGKHVLVKESVTGTAQAIVVKQHKGKKKP